MSLALSVEKYSQYKLSLENDENSPEEKPHTESLEDHLSVRSKEKPRMCSLCGKSFSWMVVLKLHQKRDSGVKNHVCFKCEKTFSTDAELKQHLIIHTGDS